MRTQSRWFPAWSIEDSIATLMGGCQSPELQDRKLLHYGTWRTSQIRIAGILAKRVSETSGRTDTGQEISPVVDK